MLIAPPKPRIPWGLVISGLVLALYYGFVYRPLTRRAASLDQPLTEAWRQLVIANLRHPAVKGLDLAGVTESHQRAQTSLAALERTSQKAEARTALEPFIRGKMKESFQLIDFQNERQLRLEALDQLAKQHQVQLTPEVLAGFPEYAVDDKQSHLLWAQLAFMQNLLTTAILCQVSAVKAIHLPPIPTRQPAEAGRATWDEIPVRIELVGPMPAIARFLHSLPRRAGESKALGLPEARPAKPALFIDKLMLRKQTPEKPDEVHLDLIGCGFIKRE